MGIQFTDLIIINIYRRNDRNIEINKKIINILRKYQNNKTIIGGDFNLNENKIKLFEKFNFKIFLNNKPSRKPNNLDYFLTNFNNLKLNKSKTIKNFISDHNTIMNKFEINSNWEINDIYKIKDIPTFQEDFLQFFSRQNFNLNEENFILFKKKYKQKERIVFDIKQDKLKINNLLYKLFDKNETLHKIKKINELNYLKLLNQINEEYNKNKNFWKTLNKIRETSTKMFLNNETIFTVYNDFVKSISQKPNTNIINYIKKFKINKNSLNPIDIKEIFDQDKIKEIIKFQKNKSVKEFDKINHYKFLKNQPIQYLLNYNYFIKTVQNIFFKLDNRRN
ncbi:hypothetical protein M0812_16857 [Anaeramoeba flamelloides]|uniref:Endonuclease/exonuclease/phosphatase domain-containing protein n=1 Tax=Anaeramoeba flamelloides TaxID=1746091 RepID=A0AAV7Z976_9EUKA|nr:hypothetical protein M0812_16857 [Anaeramoeba flamelloides]